MGIGMGLVIFFKCPLSAGYFSYHASQLFVPAVSLPSHYFKAKRSLVMGMAFAGSRGFHVPFSLINISITSQGPPSAALYSQSS